jgi:predicted Fe-S protein YdhL (DUF1289 family)
VLNNDLTCTGCGRTIGEVTSWWKLSNEEKWVIIKRIEFWRKQDKKLERKE